MKLGVIGNPIKHSLSPILHNHWFKKYKIDADYSLLDVKDNNLENIVSELENRNLSKVAKCSSAVIISSCI